MRIQVRGAGNVARSLNVRGEEICRVLETGISQIRAGTYLVRSVANADVEVRELSFHDISKNHFQAFLGRSALETLGDFGRHSRIQFHRDSLLGLLQNLRCQVSSTGTDFEDHVTLLEVGFVDDSMWWSAHFQSFDQESTHCSAIPGFFKTCWPISVFILKMLCAALVFATASECALLRFWGLTLGILNGVCQKTKLCDKSLRK